jgi:hypothetical protein
VQELLPVCPDTWVSEARCLPRAAPRDKDGDSVCTILPTPLERGAHHIMDHAGAQPEGAYHALVDGATCAGEARIKDLCLLATTMLRSRTANLRLS